MLGYWGVGRHHTTDSGGAGGTANWEYNWIGMITSLACAILLTRIRKLPSPHARLVIVNTRTGGAARPDGTKIPDWSPQGALKSELELKALDGFPFEALYLEIVGGDSEPSVAYGSPRSPEVASDRSTNNGLRAGLNVWEVNLGIAAYPPRHVGWSADPWRTVGWRSADGKRQEGRSFKCDVTFFPATENGLRGGGRYTFGPNVLIDVRMPSALAFEAVRIVGVGIGGKSVSSQQLPNPSSDSGRRMILIWSGKPGDFERFELQVRPYHWLKPLKFG